MKLLVDVNPHEVLEEMFNDGAIKEDDLVNALCNDAESSALIISNQSKKMILSLAEKITRNKDNVPNQEYCLSDRSENQ